MSKTDTTLSPEITISIEEKGDLDHAIRCAELAKERAEDLWLKQACTFRLRMLNAQRVKQR